MNVQKSDINDIKVSILCLTFNHEEYIKDALDSFLMQKTNFKYEILIHDDASTDNTPKIIQQYADKYSDIIKPIFQNENKYSKGISVNSVYQYPRVMGEYVAMCEGDDYWTDPLKLQKQVDVLDQNLKCNICAHKTVAVDAKSKEIIKYIAPYDSNQIISVNEVILGGGGFVATNSLMVRKCIVKNESKFRKFLPLDYTTQIQGSLAGGMLYLSDCMAAYRLSAKGSWTVTMKNNVDKHCEHIKRRIAMYDILNDETNGKYEREIKRCIERDSGEFLYIQKRYKELLKGNYHEFTKIFTKKQYINTYIKAYFPMLTKMLQERGKDDNNK